MFNEKLYDKMVKHIAEEKERFDMLVPVELANEQGKVVVYDFGNQYTLKPPCGTVACAAGWAVLLGEPGRIRDKAKKWAKKDWDGVFSKARRLLGITGDEAYKLFHHKNWDYEYRQAYENATTSLQRQQVGLAFFKHFKGQILQRIAEEQLAKLV